MIAHPVLRYHGGKFRLAPWVIQHMPPHRCYVEPFGGAAGVLMQKTRSYAEVYNDLDTEIVNVFRVLRDPALCGELALQLELTPYARDEFKNAHHPGPGATPVERARCTVVRSLMGFGSAGATKAHTGFRIDTRRRHGTAQDIWTRYPPLLAVFGRRLAGVMLENRPAIDVMRQHDGPDTLHYVDPPYVHSTRVRGVQHGRYYRHEMTDADHLALLEVLASLRGMVLLSGYDSPLYSDRLSGWEQRRVRSRISSGRGTSTRVECLWLNPAAVSALGEAAGLPLRFAS